MTPQDQRIHLPGGFVFAAAAAGIKSGARLDLAYVEAPGRATAAAVFTRNRVVAAPIQIARRHLRSSGGRVRAVIVNSGNANCATGAAGRRRCEQVCERLGKVLGAPTREIFPSSTGIIGVPLPVGKILTTLPQLVAAKNASPEAAFCFARAIMTTDTRPKLASARFRRGARTATVLGIAKGAGMIHPNMATMLAFVFTDIAASAGDLQSLLRAASDRTFNCISVDGDTSTNDTVLLMASGASGLSLASAAARKSFQAALSSVCQSLAEQIVADGEGVSHVVRLRVEQARNQSEASQIARAIARSLLVKTAWAGADPNWGRILAAVGASGVGVDPAGISIWLGDHQVCRRGGACDFDRAAVHDYLAQPSYSIQVRLGRGPARTDFLTCDLTAEYVRINAEYST